MRGLELRRHGNDKNDEGRGGGKSKSSCKRLQELKGKKDSSVEVMRPEMCL